MKREALVPIDEELNNEILKQQQRVRDRWPTGTPVLFPRSRANPDGSNEPATPATSMHWASGYDAATSATSTAGRST
jgi:hypothetical protein